MFFSETLLIGYSNAWPAGRKTRDKTAGTFCPSRQLTKITMTSPEMPQDAGH
jgi:hypothetical protein